MKYLKKVFFLFLFFFAITNVHAEEVVLEKEWDISSNEYEILYDLKETKDGGYATVGKKLQNGQDQATIIKYDRDGKRLWQNSIEEGDESCSLSLTVADDGSIVAVGYIYPPRGEKASGPASFGLIAKYDESGKLLWSKIYDTPFTSVIVTKKNEIAVVGSGAIVKYD